MSDAGAIRILLVEDSAADAELILHRLRELDPRELLSTRALEERRHVVVADVGRSGLSRHNRVLLQAAGVRALIALPLGTVPWGALTLYKSTPHEFDAEEIALLERLAATIDLALDFIRQRERLSHLAYHNPLTDLPNRIALRERLATRLTETAQAIAMVEVPALARHVKRRGRDFGDALLRAIGERLARLLDPGALLAHPAESVFAFTLPASPDPEAERARVEALLEGCFGEPFLVQDELVHADYRGALLHAPEHGPDPEAIERNLATALAEAVARGLKLAVYDEALRARRAARADGAGAPRGPRATAVRASPATQVRRPQRPPGGRRGTAALTCARARPGVSGQIRAAAGGDRVDRPGRPLGTGGGAVHRPALAPARIRRFPHRRQPLGTADAPGRLRRRLPRPARGGRGRGRHRHGDHRERADRRHRPQRALPACAARGRVRNRHRRLRYRLLVAELPLAAARRRDQDRPQLRRRDDHQPGIPALVNNIINLAHTLNLKVVAEGVEEEEQAKLLRLLRCDLLQGFLLGRPVAVDEFERLHLDG